MPVKCCRTRPGEIGAFRGEQTCPRSCLTREQGALFHRRRNCNSGNQNYLRGQNIRERAGTMIRTIISPLMSRCCDLVQQPWIATMKTSSRRRTSFRYPLLLRTYSSGNISMSLSSPLYGTWWSIRSDDTTDPLSCSQTPRSKVRSTVIFSD